MSEQIQPVLLGADLNCYSMARAFFAACGCRSIVLGQTALGATRYSRYVQFAAVPRLGEREVLLSCLHALKERLPPQTKPILLTGTDEYARLLMEEQNNLLPHFILPIPNKDALPFFDKAAFYQACAQYGIAYPETVVLSAMPGRADLAAAGQQLGYPLIIKPARSDDYWHYPFAGMEKVYLAHNKNEAECVLAAIFGSGYPGRVLLQRYIAGGDRAGYVLTVYFDRTSKPCLRACGRALLEEHTPCGKGNYAALMTAPIPSIAEPLCHMLSDVGYCGFANFDLRQDARDGRLYALELNLRPGRSNYFLMAGGHNPAALLLADHVEKQQLPHVDMQQPLLFRTVPFSVVWQYTEKEEDALAARALHRAGQEACPLYDRADLLANPLRALYVAEYMRRQKQKFRQYCTRVR